ncbi:MAG: alpha/beta fold hydrolase, partial [Acidimicrobiia bacterium]|nr:alpha/beta fold hydrolase [Acidimicrobiia bacterium]
AAHIDDPIVLVAHSSGGLVVPGVVDALNSLYAPDALNSLYAPDAPDALNSLYAPDAPDAVGRRVERIVLNAALVPSEGGTGLDGMQRRHAEGLAAAVETAARNGTAITLPGPPADPEQFRSTYGGDPLSDDDLAFVVDPVRCVPDTVHHYFQPVRWSRARGIPVTYVLNERDRPIPPALQEDMIARLPDPPSVIRLDTGHIPAVTDPRQLAAALA